MSAGEFESRLDLLDKVKAIQAERDALRVERDAIRAKIAAAGDILGAVGCGCECDCDSTGHFDACELCLVCRINGAIGGGAP